MDDLARCDREIASILNRSDVRAGECPAWLVALGVNDWEVERVLILREARSIACVPKIQDFQDAS